MIAPVAAAFYFDLASPLAYIAAERILQVLPGPAEWRPALGSELGAQGFEAFRCAEEEAVFREEVERRARALGLMPVRWPDPFPFDSTQAMLVAAYAAAIGRSVGFAQAAFRQAFAAGRALEDRDSILIAAAACEMHPEAVLAAIGRRSVAQRLADSTRAAAAWGVRELPAVVVGDEVFVGERALEDAARAYGAAIAGGRV